MPTSSRFLLLTYYLLAWGHATGHRSLVVLWEAHWSELGKELMSLLQTLASALILRLEGLVAWCLGPAWEASCKISGFSLGKALLFTDSFNDPIIERASSESPKCALINLCFLFYFLLFPQSYMRPWANHNNLESLEPSDSWPALLW